MDKKMKAKEFFKEQWGTAFVGAKLSHKDGILELSMEDIYNTMEKYKGKTGKHDKNGKKICDGDILSDLTEVDGKMVQSHQKVFWNEKTATYCLDFSKEQDESCSIELWKALEDFEYWVSGNVNEQ